MRPSRITRDEAAKRLVEIASEIAHIVRVFPSLRRGRWVRRSESDPFAARKGIHLRP